MGLISRHAKMRRELFDALDRASPKERAQFALACLTIAGAALVALIVYIILFGWR